MTTTTVICPECRRAATVMGRFTQAGAGGVPVEYLRIRCSGLLSVLVTADEVEPAAPPEPVLAAA